MIVLDTNVISELAKPLPDSAVMAWTDAQRRDQMHATVISEAEMLYGVNLLPDGRRRREPDRAAQAMFDVVLGGWALPFDRAAAESFASLASARRRKGRPVGKADQQIAAIAHSRNARFIVTRNTADFADRGFP